MSQKKQPPKTQGKGKSVVFIERYREIELYLNLLTKPFLSTIFPTTAVGTSHIFDKVENEIKTFIETKLEELTGLSNSENGISFSKAEISALKMVASTVLNKEKTNVTQQFGTSDVEDSNVTSELPESERDVDGSQTEEVDQSFESNDVIVSKVGKVETEQEEPVKKVPTKTKKLPVKVYQPTEVPDVTFGNPTDTMKRARPKGVKPLPQPTPEQMAQMASAQAEAAQAALLGAQMNQAAHLLPDNLGMPNLDFPTFR